MSRVLLFDRRRITTEMLDIYNRDHAKVTKVDDFIVSEKLISLLSAKISESVLLDPVFEDLLNLGRRQPYCTVRKKVKLQCARFLGVK